MQPPSPPTPGTLSYPKLIEHIETGVYQIPKFQRGFVWNIEEAAALLDSLIRGFPIGSFILWKTRERMGAHRGFGDKVFKRVPDADSVCYVLDGQQRMTSLYLATQGVDLDNAAFSQIHVDFDKDPNGEEPVCVREKPKCGALVSDLAVTDPSALVRVIDEVKEKHGSDAREAAIRVHQAINNYTFATVEVANSLGKVAWMFERLNKHGRQLKPFEIVSARVYEEGKDQDSKPVVKFDLEDKFKETAKFLGERVPGYGLADDNKSRNSALQMVAAVAKGDIRREVIYDIPKGEFVSSWDASRGCLHLAAAFARSRLKLPALRMLPYPALLTPIAYFFHKNGGRQPNPGQVEQLSRLFYRIAFGQRYLTAVETRMTHDLRLVDKIAEGRPVDLKILDVPDADESMLVDKLLMENFAAGNASHKAVLCLLAAKDPARLDDARSRVLDGDDLHRSLSKNRHHVFPKGNPKWKNHDRINAIANLMFLDAESNQRIGNRAPSDYVAEFCDGAPAESGGLFKPGNADITNALESHFISPDEDGIWDDDFDKFLQTRARRLAREILKKIGE